MHSPALLCITLQVGKLGALALDAVEGHCAERIFAKWPGGPNLTWWAKQKLKARLSSSNFLGAQNLPRHMRIVLRKDERKDLAVLMKLKELALHNDIGSSLTDLQVRFSGTIALSCCAQSGSL